MPTVTTPCWSRVGQEGTVARSASGFEARPRPAKRFVLPPAASASTARDRLASGVAAVHPRELGRVGREGRSGRSSHPSWARIATACACPEPRPPCA
jgi:hypothetical protein